VSEGELVWVERRRCTISKWRKWVERGLRVEKEMV
jgi:hypothetical protein